MSTTTLKAGKSPSTMPWLILAILLGAAAAGTTLRPTESLAEQLPEIRLEQTFPERFAGWQAMAAPLAVVNPQQQATLDAIYAETVNRVYVNADGSAAMMLSVAYGRDQSDSKAVHYPEVCYPAQGFQILSMRRDVARIGQRSIPVKRLVASAGPRVEYITYWVMVGDRPTATGWQHKSAQIGYGMKGLIPDGMLVRVSSIGGDEADAYRAHDAFLSGLVQAVPAAARPRVAGL